MGIPVSISVIAVLLLIGSSQSYGSDLDEYGVILDARATSTKLHVYRISHNGETLPEVKLIESFKQKPGILDAGTYTEDIVKYLSVIMEKAKAAVPEESRSKTSLYYFSTSGMSGITKHALQMTNPKFKFDAKKNVQVYTGQQEGALSWVAVNFLTGFFLSPEFEKSKGLVDMGGSSTNLAFLVDHSLNKEQCKVKVANKDYNLFAHSYTQFGADDVLHLMADLMAQKRKRSLSVGNACILKGDSKTEMTNDGQEVVFDGEGSGARCGDLFYEVIENNFQSCGGEATCPPYPMIPKDMKFYATGAFVYPAQDVYAFDDPSSPVLKFNHYREAADSYCETTFEQVGDWFPDIAKDLRSSRCYYLKFAVNLLQELGFDWNTDNIIASNQIHQQQIDWTLGAMVMLASGSPMPCSGSSKKREVDTLETRALVLDYLLKALKEA